MRVGHRSARLAALGLAGLLLMPSAWAAPALKVIDDLGRTVQLSAPASRIVTLAPHATELLFEIGAGAQLVAVERNSDHPPQARALPTLSAWPRPDPERLLALAPDLVVLWGAGDVQPLARRLETLGITVFVSTPRSFAAIADTLERLGVLTGTGPRADRIATTLRARIADLRAQHAQRARVPVFVQVWSRPLMTLSDRDLIGDALAACGARNVFGGLAQASAEVDPEAVLQRAPRLIIGFDADAGRERWERLGVLAPQGTVAYVQGDRVLQRPVARALDALEALCTEIARAR